MKGIIVHFFNKDSVFIIIEKNEDVEFFMEYMIDNCEDIQCLEKVSVENRSKKNEG